ncbi:MAG: NYN domain-containing protein [Acidimicrobiia bacterium]
MADHFVIDGSNLATEGRTEPSLAQLQEAVAAFHTEHPGAVATVVVDASFEHRIDPAERAAFAKTEAAGEVVSPPAGAVGRGDGFLLQIADRTGGTVISNDSFQEFHAEYEWLFEPGRLIGGKPVPGVGWIFSLRRPVRGIVSRKTVQKAKQGGKEEKKVQKAIAEATASALQPDAPKRRRRRGGRGRSSGGGASKETNDKPEPEAVNEPASFLQFVIDHRLGTEVAGTVEAFASHGAFVNVDGVRCYVPLSAMGRPQPSRARDVLTRDETRTFVVQAVDAPRRGIELGLPGFATVAGAPSEETVAAELGTRRTKAKKATPEKPEKAVAKKVARKAAKPAKKAATPQATKKKAPAKPAAPEPPVAKQTRSQKKVAAKERRVAEVMETIAAEKAAAASQHAPASKSRAKKPAPAKQQTAKPQTAKQPAKKSTAKKAAAKSPAKTSKQPAAKAKKSTRKRS